MEQSIDQESGIIELRFTYSAWKYATLIIYQKLDGSNKSFVDFLAEICILLMYEVSSTADSEYDVHPEVYRSMRSADIPREKRYGKFNHWLILIGTPNSQRYKYKHCNKKRNINA